MQLYTTAQVQEWLCMTAFKSRSRLLVSYCR